MAPALPTRQLGRNGPHVTAQGLGLMGLSGFYGPVMSDEERLLFLTKAHDMGQTNWDSADMYVDSEDLLGKWFARNPEKRQHVFLATKFGNKVLPDGSRAVDSSPEYCKAACEKSLKRLGLPFVDLYYCHRLDGKTPIEHTVHAMADLKNQGKFKYLGLSECSAASLRRAHAVHPISAVQIEYNPFSLDIEHQQNNLLSTCRELGVAVIAYSPLSRGLLGGQIKSRDDFPPGDFRQNAPRFSEANFHHNLELVHTITSMAERKGVTPSQLTLAWLMAQGGDVIPIPGTTKASRLEENLQAMGVKLTREEEAEIRHACERADVKGGRYPEPMTKALFADTPALAA